MYSFKAINRLSRWTLTAKANEWKDLNIGDEEYREIFKAYVEVQNEKKEARKHIRGSVLLLVKLFRF